MWKKKGQLIDGSVYLYKDNIGIYGGDLSWFITYSQFLVIKCRQFFAIQISTFENDKKSSS